MVDIQTCVSFELWFHFLCILPELRNGTQTVDMTNTTTSNQPGTGQKTSKIDGYVWSQHNGSSGKKKTPWGTKYLLATSCYVKQWVQSRSVPALATNNMFGFQTNAGWWFQPLWKTLVSWDYYSHYMEKSKMFQTTNQNESCRFSGDKKHHVACRSWFHLRCHARLQIGITTRAVRMGHINDALLLLSLSPEPSGCGLLTGWHIG